jgi:hypothetical protein
VSHPVAVVPFIYQCFFYKVSKILKVFFESLVYAVLCLKILAFYLKLFGNGSHLKPKYENGNLISSRTFSKVSFP